MLSIKEVLIFEGDTIKILLTIDGPEDITLLAQLLAPLAKHTFIVEEGEHANNVFSDVIEYGKSQLRINGAEAVFMAVLYRLTYSCPEDPTAICYQNGVSVDIFTISKSRDILATDVWQALFENCDQPEYSIQARAKI